MGIRIATGEVHLRRLLRDYFDYYNRRRTRLALAQDTSLTRPVQYRVRIIPVPKFGGFHHAYIRI